ncbi:hypothetical protein POV27_10620 [Aureisphaera galaxeae]|uniref:hypothetical protein n=1 Tax=Aureisphaera galaxeae TaxID=1538023 RepID=UPI00235031C3|nr:hypothetical protein [Aureisphaera galaxeae]MDC8004501.1 hypothetical protein [Aureisphaera galaxeae]
MKLIYSLIIICSLVYGTQAQNVGINTTNPQQALHMAGTSATIRVEGLDATNNSYNGGDTEPDGDLTNNTYPLYVDDAGDFTLELKTIYGSEEVDAFDDTSLPTSTATLLATSSTGEVTVDVFTYSITVPRATVLEVKYGMSYDIFLDNTYAIITDNLARRIQTHVVVTGDTREYATASKSYSSGTSNSVAGPFYNSGTAYISLPSAGAYDITIQGRVSSNTKASGGGTTSKATYVEFATHNDFLFMRLY